MGKRLATALVLLCTAAFAQYSSPLIDSLLPRLPIVAFQQSTKTDSLLQVIIQQVDSVQRTQEKVAATSAATENRTNWRYFWSALAQSIAALAALVFAATFAVAQLTARYGLKRAERLFGGWNILKLALLLLAVALPLLALICRWGARPLVAVSAAVLSAGVLILHFVQMKGTLSIKSIVNDLKRKAEKQLPTSDSECREIRQVAMAAADALDFPVLKHCAAVLAQMSVETSAPGTVGTNPATRELKQLAAATVERPSVMSEALRGGLSGLVQARSGPFLEAVNEVTGPLSNLLLGARWPLYEPVYATYFQMLGPLLKRVAKSAPTDRMAWDVAVRQTVEEPLKLLEKAGQSSEPKYSGSGEAWLELVRAYAGCAQSCGSDERGVKLAQRCARAIRDFSKQGWSGQNATRTLEAYKVIHEMYSKIAAILDENEPFFPEAGEVIKAGGVHLIVGVFRSLLKAGKDKHCEEGLKQFAYKIRRDGRLTPEHTQRLALVGTAAPVARLLEMENTRREFPNLLAATAEKTAGHRAFFARLADYLADVAVKAREAKDVLFKDKLLITAAETLRARAFENTRDDVLTKRMVRRALLAWVQAGTTLFLEVSEPGQMPSEVHGNLNALCNSIQPRETAQRLREELGALRDALADTDEDINKARKGFLGRMGLTLD